MSKIHFEPGQTFDPKHLRDFDLALALQGHPLATRSGKAVRCLRFISDDWLAWDSWGLTRWLSGESPIVFADANLRLAPLAFRDERPLHVGDEIATYREEWLGFQEVISLTLEKWEQIKPGVGLSWQWPKKTP